MSNANEANAVEEGAEQDLSRPGSRQGLVEEAPAIRAGEGPGGDGRREEEEVEAEQRRRGAVYSRQSQLEGPKRRAEV